ncbi:MAG: MinD/ParA family protein [Planctomycetota bacterium]|nr:MinD/ParA family protein [Planctomycetota bacterium]
MSTVPDQAARLRALVEQATRNLPARADAAPAAPVAPPAAGGGTAQAAAARRCRVIAVASGKGGVGKTTIALNTALCLAAEGVETLLMDGDLGLGNADVLCGLAPGPHLGHVVDGSRTLDEVAVRIVPRMTLVPCGSGVAGLADLGEEARGRLLGALAELERRTTALVIDCGAGIGRGVLDLVSQADLALVVTTPEPTAIADAYALIKCAVGGEAGRGESGVGGVALVVNQAQDVREGRAVFARVKAVCDRFLALDLPLAGVILKDEAVGRAVRARRPLTLMSPGSRAACDVRDLSGFVMGRMRGGVVWRGGGEGLAQRLWRAVCGRAAERAREI